MTSRDVQPGGDRDLASPRAGSTLEIIAPDECIRLLATMSVGRIAVASGADAPIVVPVNYAVDGDVIVFRADRGTRLDGLQDQKVAFEVDLIDPYQKVGWSILVRGTAHQATAEEATHVEVDTWIGGIDMHWIRITSPVITGRRIQLPPLPQRLRGYL
ncbi:MAG TPA: pyridoxamine 5'-phosphate oxidase family protein [Acidimicrobiales bacterium]|nr:pyridoxamine 5'-phosphate oxidase family protein [Acidimicrobiales bacterium]